MLFWSTGASDRDLPATKTPETLLRTMWPTENRLGHGSNLCKHLRWSWLTYAWPCHSSLRPFEALCAPICFSSPISGWTRKSAFLIFSFAARWLRRTFLCCFCKLSAANYCHPLLLLRITGPLVLHISA